MPAQTAKVNLNLGAAIRKHAKDETVEPKSFSELPGGIEDGVAQLVDIKIDTYKSGDKIKGKPYFSATGIVLQPEYAFESVQAWEGGRVVDKGVRKSKVVGQRTNIRINLFESEFGDKVTTKDDQVGKMLNQIRLLGDPEGTDPNNYCTANLQTEEDLAALFQALLDKQNPIYFPFTTWRPKPTATQQTPRVVHKWFRRLENWTPENLSKSNYITDNTGTATTSANGAGAGSHEPFDADRDTSTTTATSTETESEDLDQLAEAADQGDVQAQSRLSELAGEAGISEESVQEAASFADVAEMIRASESDQQEGTDDAEELVIKKGNVCHYHPIGKDKKPSKKPVECEIISVDNTKKVCTLKSLEDGKTVYKAVKFSEVSK
jgi:hypothetical protein